MSDFSIKPLDVDQLTLKELQERLRTLNASLRSEDATARDAKHHQQICNAIRLIKEAKEIAVKWNGGKLTETELLHPERNAPA